MHQAAQQARSAKRQRAGSIPHKKARPAKACSRCHKRKRKQQASSPCRAADSQPRQDWRATRSAADTAQPRRRGQATIMKKYKVFFSVTREGICDLRGVHSASLPAAHFCLAWLAPLLRALPLRILRGITARCCACVVVQLCFLRCSASLALPPRYCALPHCVARCAALLRAAAMCRALCLLLRATFGRRAARCAAPCADVVPCYLSRSALPPRHCSVCVARACRRVSAALLVTIIV